MGYKSNRRLKGKKRKYSLRWKRYFDAWKRWFFGKQKPREPLLVYNEL